MTRTATTRGLLLPLCVLLALAGICASPAVAGPGDPKSGFGQAGITTLGSGTRLLDVAVQRGGKVVVAGTSSRGTRRGRLLVQRFTAGGRPDPGFRGGKPFLGPAGTAASAVEVRGDGRIVVAGTVTDRSGGLAGMLAMRLKPNGARDRSFGGDGAAVALGRYRSEGLALALSSGGVLVAGSSTPLDRRDGYSRVALARFKANGRPDRRFGRGGVAVLDLGRLSVAEDVAIQRGGKIVVAGSVRDNLQSTEALAARLRPGGGLDRSFGRGGVLRRQYASGAAFSAFRALALRGGGRVLLAGTALTSAQGPKALVVQLNSRGRADRRFGGDGSVYVRAAENANQYNQTPLAGAYDVDLAGGDIVLAGYHDELTLKEGALWALRPGGALDRRFGNRGHAYRRLGGDAATFNGLDGGARLLAAGERTDPFRGTSNGIVAAYSGPGGP